MSPLRVPPLNAKVQPSGRPCDFDARESRDGGTPLLTPLTCLAPLRADALGWTVAGADAKESTAIRETRELKEEIFKIPLCAY
jgi:hypothetical protein